MEAAGSRFTPPEGGTRLAITAAQKNILATEYASFVTTRLIYEEAYKIRGSLSEGRQRSVYVTRASRVKVTAYDLTILTDLKVTEAVEYDAVNDWTAQMEIKEVLVCTSQVFRQILQRKVLTMPNINVLVIDSSHLVFTDENLQFIMKQYKECPDSVRPRILAHTYPLFTNNTKAKPQISHEETKNGGVNEEEMAKDGEIGTVTTKTEEQETQLTEIINTVREEKQLADNQADSHVTNDDKLPLIASENSDAKTENKSPIDNSTNDTTKRNDNNDNVKLTNHDIKNKETTNPNDKSDLINEKDTTNSAKSNSDLKTAIDISTNNADSGTTIESPTMNANSNSDITTSNETETKNATSHSDSTKTDEKPTDDAETKIDSTTINISPNSNAETTKISTDTAKTPANPLNVYENLDDFDMYEKLEWKISELERELCCEMDLAEDIDGGKRIAITVAKPKELIVEYDTDVSKLQISQDYRDLDTYMRETVADAEKFLYDHRYDPTEIYGDDLYEEFKSIPDPKIEPRSVFQQFIYALDELGPYGADKAAFTLLARIEKLKIKVPYERHFLLLCLCTTVFVKIRCYADSILSKYDNDWTKITLFCTPKVHRLAEILEHFQPADSKRGREIDGKKKTKDTTDVAKEKDDKTKNRTNSMLQAIEKCDFKKLSDKIEDKLNEYEANLKEIPEFDVVVDVKAEIDKESNDKETGEVIVDKVEDGQKRDERCGKETQKGNRRTGKGASGRPHRLHHSSAAADSLCAVVFLNHAFMPKILFSLLVDMSRCHPALSYICAQYCCSEPARQPSPAEARQREDVLKKFRMHDCNLLLATSSLEEGIDLPRCSLVLRWDIPPCYRSHCVCRGRARAARAAAALCSPRDVTPHMLRRLAVYTELDQIITRKCGCGIQNEPTQADENAADLYCPVVRSYTPHDGDVRPVNVNATAVNVNATAVNVNATAVSVNSTAINVKATGAVDVGAVVESTAGFAVRTDCEAAKVNMTDAKNEVGVMCDSAGDGVDCQSSASIVGGFKVGDKLIGGEGVASVDLNSAIALINRYCGKLPSDTFTRLAPYWKTEKLQLPAKDGGVRDAFVCTLRLPLNAPVKYNIVGHPMPTEILARRMAALQACRILHKSGELDDHLMPIGKENFRTADQSADQSADLVAENLVPRDHEPESEDAPRPGTTKRRQYYYKRTATAFTDCEPVIDACDCEVYPDYVHGEDECIRGKTPSDHPDDKGKKRNMLYCIVSRLWCALPERYNTRGRRLHAPQRARTAQALLMSRRRADSLQIPAFPVYTRSGEVRVSIEYIPEADVRISPRRARLIRRFMRFVFAEVLRVRRCGMKLETNGLTHNNYYIVPTIKTVNEDGTSTINVDWAFIELIYQHTEEKKHSDLDKPILWHLDDEEMRDIEKERAIAAHSKAANTILTNDQTITSPKLEVASTSEPVKVTESVKVTELVKVTAPVKVTETKEKREKHLENPLLKPGEVFVFDAEKYKEAVVTPWYRNQDQPQFFLVAEICWHLRPDSGFSSAAHATFREYYAAKYGAKLTQRDQPLLDVDHTSARLNLLTPRYVNRKGVALPVSSERTRRAKRDRLDQKQILVPELCRVHPFAAPLWFATVALPCVLYRINALLIADEIRQAVARDVGLGVAKIDEKSAPGFQWPPLDFGWSLAEVLNAEEKNEKKKSDEDENKQEDGDDDLKQIDGAADSPGNGTVEVAEKTINDILAEKEAADSGFEIGTWSNDMAAAIQAEPAELLAPLPHNLTFCTSASGGTNWCDPVEEPRSLFNPTRRYSVADSDCSLMSSDFDTDSDLNSDASDDETDTSGFCSKSSNATMGVRIEYKTAHEAEAVEIEKKKTNIAPAPDEADDERDREICASFIRSGDAPTHYVEKFQNAVKNHQKELREKSVIVYNKPVSSLLPEVPGKDQPYSNIDKIHNNLAKSTPKTDPEKPSQLIDEMFPYKTDLLQTIGDKISIESIERNKRLILNEFKDKLSRDEVRNLHCFSMIDVDIDSPEFVNEKISNVGFDTKEEYIKRFSDWDGSELKPFYMEGKAPSGEFDFDYQPELEGHPGPSPSIILQALTMSNANDGINLERLETVGDSFLKLAITAHLYCAHARGHEGKLSHMRSKQVSNLNLYRLGRGKCLGARMTAMKFEPHDNWLPPCHTAPPPLPSEVQECKKDSPDNGGCFIPYNLITQHSIPDKSIADCVEALIGAYLLECGPRGALLLMSWLGISVLPLHLVPLKKPPRMPPTKSPASESDIGSLSEEDWVCHRPVGSLRPRQNEKGEWVLPVFGELKAPPSPLLRYVENPEGELERMLSGYEELERTLQYRFRDRALLLQAMTHASHHDNRLTDCYQRLEFLGDAILDYLITRHLYEDSRRHSPGALTDLRSALVNNTIFATMAARHGFHKYFRHMSPGLNEVLTKYIKIQEENGHSISEEHYLIQEDEMEQAEDVEVPKALGDLFESVAGAIFLDSGMSLGAVWGSYVRLMGAELEAFSAAAPKSPVRELLEAEPDTAKFGKPERLADGRRVRVCVEVFGRGSFRGVGRNYRIAKGTAARCALRHLKNDRHR